MRVSLQKSLPYVVTIPPYFTDSNEVIDQVKFVRDHISQSEVINAGHYSLHVYSFLCDIILTLTTQQEDRARLARQRVADWNEAQQQAILLGIAAQFNGE